MKRVVIIGGGFTGLVAAYQLLKKKYHVTIIEKDKELGGLASSFKPLKWEWSLEKYYHHWFTNDHSILHLAQELKHPVIIKKPNTDLFYKDKIYAFDSPLSILKFPFFTLVDKVRLSFSLLYLKLSSSYAKFEQTLAIPWIEKYMGINVGHIVWEPLFNGKFGEYKNKISLTWFWARIKKRTPKLAYPSGGFASFTQSLVKKIQEFGGDFLLSDTVVKIRKQKNGFTIQTAKGQKLKADKILVTTQSSLLPKLFPTLSQSYKKRIGSNKFLSAQVLVMRLAKKFMDKTYWLSMSDPASPFLAVVEHTNYMNPKHYDGEHVVYIGNYLKQDHPYLLMNPNELLKVFDPELSKINPNYKKYLIDLHLFKVPGAQPIVDIGYHRRIPKMVTPIKGVFLANMEMVYPWDRGTNYAVQYGEKVADLIANDFS